MYFYGVLAGANASFSLLGQQTPYCFSGEKTDFQVIEGIISTLQSLPDLQSLSAPGAIIIGLRETEPCNAPSEAGGAVVERFPDAFETSPELLEPAPEDTDQGADPAASADDPETIVTD
jgi:hypothetical protein